MSLQFFPQDLTKECGEISDRIGSNSEKPLNSSQTMTGLEVENKSATPYSSRRAREDPEKRIFSSFSFLPSTFLGPSENLRRMERQLIRR